MASLREIRKRIRSVKSTSKITKAMKMVAAAKLRRSQEEVRRARAYAIKLDQTISHVAAKLEHQGEAPHPLLTRREQPRTIELLVLTSDRGLCGGFNSNVIRRAQRFLFENKGKYEKIQVSCIGRKGYDVLKRDLAIRKNYEHMLHPVEYRNAAAISVELCDLYERGEVDEVWLVYNEFRSAISQTVVVKQMLPIVAENAEIASSSTVSSVDYIYEPSQEELLSTLIPQHFATKLHQSFLESVASEHGARMTSMENATKNANEMIAGLALQYNRLRQAAITKELMEIIGGSEAMAQA